MENILHHGLAIIGLYLGMIACIIIGDNTESGVTQHALLNSPDARFNLAMLVDSDIYIVDNYLTSADCDAKIKSESQLYVGVKGVAIQFLCYAMLSDIN